MLGLCLCAGLNAASGERNWDGSRAFRAEASRVSAHARDAREAKGDHKGRPYARREEFGASGAGPVYPLALALGRASCTTALPADGVPSAVLKRAPSTLSPATVASSTVPGVAVQ